MGNVPNKREQRELASSAERTGQIPKAQPKGNVPTLRFPEFSEEWKRSTIKDECTINPKTEELDEEFLYIDLESVVKGSLVKQNIIQKSDAPSRAQRVLQKGDILYQCVRPYQLNNFFVADDSHIQRVASTGYAQIRTPHNPQFVYQLLHTKKITDQVINRCTGTNYPAINSTDLSSIGIDLPGHVEQTKIASFLKLIDERIATQSKIIERYQSLIRALRHKLLDAQRNEQWSFLGNYCTITTGKLDANAMTEDGEYMFFTCARENYKTDSYAFEGDALLISGNGELGLTKRYSGKFNAYQRTYVLQSFKIDIDYAKYAIEEYLPRKIYREKNVGAMPYIVFSTLSDLSIPVPEIKTQKSIVDKMRLLEKKTEVERETMSNFQIIKHFLLSSLFI